MDESVGKAGDDWGYQPGKGGMAIEAKLGLFIIMILVSAFGFLVYRNVDRHQQLMAEHDGTSAEQSDSDAISESPGTPVSSLEETSANDLTLNNAALDDGALNDVVLAEPDTENVDRAVDLSLADSDSEPGLIASWDEPAAQEPAAQQPESVPSFDVVAAETDASDVDPFALDNFEEEESVAFVPEQAPPADPATPETQDVASIDAMPALEFGQEQPDESGVDELPGFPEFSEPTSQAPEPGLAFSQEDSESIIPQETVRNSAQNEPRDQAVQPSEPAMFGQFAEQQEAGQADDFAESDSDPLVLGVVNEPSLAAARPPVESTDEFSEFPESDFPESDFTAVPPQSADAGLNGFEPLPEELPIADSTDPPIDISDQFDTNPDQQFDSIDESVPDLTLTPEPAIADRDDSFPSDNLPADSFPSFEPGDSPPSLTLTEPEVADERQPVFPDSPPASGIEDVEDYSQFALQDADDEQVARLKPVTPAGGAPVRDPAAFDVQVHAYENPVITTSAESEAYDICEVQPGDNYWRISRRMYGTSRYFSALALYNHHRVRDPKLLRPGMKILVPDPDVLEARYPELFRDSQPREQKPGGYFVQPDGTPAYRIGEQDTLSEIAQKHLGRSSRWIQIYRLNRNVLSNPNRLKPGTVIILPDSATNVQMVP